MLMGAFVIPGRAKREPGMTIEMMNPFHLTPVPLQRWHLTTLSPFLTKPLPSQFLHFCFFLMLGPFSLDIRFAPGHRTQDRDRATYSVSPYSINDLRTEMITRRTLISTAIAGLLAGAVVRPSFAEPASPNDPVAVLTAIYTRVTKGKGDSGGGFVIENKAAKAKYLSKSLIELWAKADAHTPKGDVGPIDFDPVTNSQDSDVKSFKLVTEKLEADKVAIAVTIIGSRPRAKAADQTVHYDFVRDGDKWKIDDIKGSDDGTAWSIRGMLEESLKT
jgi:hypothetical protein